jgi:hypothetical protein
MPTPARPIKWALRNGNGVIVTMSGRSLDHPPLSSSNQRGARLRSPVYASDPSNKESALRRHPQPKAVRTVRRAAEERRKADPLVGPERKMTGICAKRTWRRLSGRCSPTLDAFYACCRRIGRGLRLNRRIRILTAPSEEPAYPLRRRPNCAGPVRERCRNTFITSLPHREA